MGGLPRPDLSPGPHRELVLALHQLHHRAGWPSLRKLAAVVGVSPTTVSGIFSTARLPTWGALELLVEALQGDVDEFKELWLAAGSQSGEVLPAVIAGRVAELAVVRRHLRRSGLLLVTGEAGIGKSRLVTVATQAEPEVIVVTGHCLPLSTQVPLLPVVELLRSAWERDGGVWVRAAFDRCPEYVAVTVHPLLPEVGDARQAVAAGDSGDPSRLMFALETLLDALATVRALAVVLEDLHWADAATLDLLEHLVARGTATPLVATYRTEDQATPREVDEWLRRVKRGDRVRVLILRGLTRDESATQVEILTGQPASAELVDEIYTRARGHPLFTEHLVAGERADPSVLADLLDSKIDPLDGASWRIAGALAVVDRRLSEEALAKMVELDPMDLVDGLRDLRHRFLLDTATAEGVTLRHPLLSEAIRRRLTQTEQRGLHGDAASVLAAAADPQAAEVAEHWLRAGLVDRGLEWSIRAAKLADARSAVHEAADLWQRVVGMWPEDLDAVGEDPQTRIATYLAAINACRLAARTEDARMLAARAMELLDGLATADAAELLRLAAANRSLTDADRRGKPALISRSVELYETLPPGEGLVRALDLKALVLHNQGDHEGAADQLRRAVEVLDELGPLPMARSVQASLALQEAMTGDIPRALERVKRAAQTPTSSPEPQRNIYIAMCHTDVLLVAARPAAELRAAAADAITGARDLDLMTNDVSSSLANVATALLQEGEVATAADWLAPWLSHAPTPDAWDVHLVQADVDIAAGNLTSAREQLDRLAELPWALGLPELTTSQVLLDLWSGRRDGVTDRVLETLESQAAIMPGRSGHRMVTGARAAADELTSPTDERRRAAYLRLRALEDQHPGLWQRTPVDAAARPQWLAELARLAGRGPLALWADAAAEWDAVRRRHDSAYCRWRGAQVALAAGHGTVAQRLLKRAARDASEHRPLSAAIAATAAYAPRT